RPLQPRRVEPPGVWIARVAHDRRPRDAGRRHRRRGRWRGGGVRAPLGGHGADASRGRRTRRPPDFSHAHGDRPVAAPSHRAGRDGAQRRGRRAARRPRPAAGSGVGYRRGDAVTELLLRVRDLRTYFVTEQGRGTARAVDGVSFDLHAGETLGIVGESGCGKTVTSLSLLRLIPEPPGHILPGSFIELEGRNLLTLAPKALRAIRGNEMAMIFHEPMTSLNPVFTVGDQIAEAAIVHQGLSR